MTTLNATPAVPAAAAPAAPAAVVAKPEDDFDAVFAEITKTEDTTGKPDKPGATENPTAVAAAVDDKAKPDGAAPAAVAGDAAVVPGEPAVVAVEPAVAAVAAVAPTELEAAQARIAELEAEAKKPAVATADPGGEEEDPPAVATADPKPIEWYKPTTDEVTALAAYEKEWPEISAAEAMRTKAAVYNVAQYIFAEITKTYGPVLDRFKGMSDAIADQLSLQEIRHDHNDYDTIYDNVVEWVDTLPVAFKAGAKEIMNTGTPAEVSQLVAEYKKAHPAAAAPAAVAAVAAPVKTELSPAAKKAASKLTVVDSKRTAQTTVVDPSDFDGAWAEATAAGK